MRISKSTHLMRLLQTQDVVLALLVYVLVIDLAWLTDYFTWSAVKENMQRAPLVLVLAIIAAIISKPRLHGQTYLGHLGHVLRTIGIIVGGILIVSFVGRLPYTSRVVMVGYAGLLAITLLLNRAFLTWYYLTGRKEHHSNYLKVLVIGTGARATELINAYRENSEWGIEIVGTLDPEPGVAALEDVPCLGSIQDIGHLLATEVIDEVIVCLPRSLINDIEAVVRACEEQAVCLKYMADFYDMQSKQVSLEHVGKLPVLAFEPVALDESKLVVKRIIDLLITVLSLPVLLPVFAVVAVAIKLNSAGPVFFVQRRVGLNKRLFPMIKFRSMYVDAEQRLAEVEHLNEAKGPIFKIRNDPRCTSVGKFLRRTSIDELPQLINVLLGHMSLVGPRPMSLRDVEQFSLGVQRKRFSVKPGLACLREVSGRSELSFERWLELDLKYIDEWSIALDFRILCLLVPSVLKGDGAS